VCRRRRRQRQAQGDTGAWEPSVWLLSDGPRLSTRHQSPPSASAARLGRLVDMTGFSHCTAVNHWGIFPV